jgi:hypothetical protein
MVSSFWQAESVFRVHTGEDLSLAAGKQAGAVDPGQHAHLGGERADFVPGAAVHAMALQQPGLDDLLLELIGDLVQVLVHLGIVLQKQLVPMLDELFQRSSRTFLSSVSMAALASSVVAETILSNSS